MGKPKNKRAIADNEARAVTRLLRVSPRKLNDVAAIIRGKKVDSALADLTFSRRRIAGDVKKTLESAIADVDALRRKVQALHQQTGNEDLEHADLGLQITRHAIGEVIEHTGLGGHIAGTPDRALHDRVSSWRKQVQEIKSAGEQMLAEHDNEDLETALKALEIADGSLHEVEERYE